MLRTPAMLHTFAPRPAAAALAALRCSVLMCGRSQMSARPDMRGISVFCGRLLAVSYILVAMGRCPQTCMIKLRIAPRFGAPAMLHPFAPRPAAAALAALRCSVLMCGRSQMSARPDMRAYPSLRPLARCLIILSDYLYKIKHQC